MQIEYKIMQIKYKRVKILMPHCGDCGQMLMGENSYMNPYRCPCGVWESTPREPFIYRLKNDHERI